MVMTVAVLAARLHQYMKCVLSSSVAYFTTSVRDIHADIDGTYCQIKHNLFRKIKFESVVKSEQSN